MSFSYLLINTLTPTRRQIIEVIDNLPDDAFSELVSFIGYLRYKAVETKTNPPHNSFLPSIVGEGASKEKTPSKMIAKRLLSLV